MIQSKLRKDVMDYFFLNDVKNLRQCTQRNIYETLNPLEKILLAFALKDNDNLQTKTLKYFKKTQENLKIDPQELDKLLSLERTHSI